MAQTAQIQFVHVHGGAAIDRIVYDLQFIAAQKMEVGYVKVNGRNIPVFRAYDPEDMKKGAPWRKGYWSEIYDMNAVSGLEKVSVRGASLVLPNVCIRASSAIIVHLNAVLGKSVAGHWESDNRTDNVVDFPKHV